MATNYTSDLQTLGQGAGFSFEVGAFVTGFTPTPDNTGLWAANWIPAGGAEYHTVFSFAAGSAAITDEIPVGSQGYIWGFDSREAGAVEWILVTDATWIWSVSDALSQPADWTVGTADESVLGTVGSGDMPFHMKTAAVLLGTDIQSDAQAWLAQHFAGELESPISAWDADADDDGIANALEFAFGTLPRDARSAVRSSVIHVDTAGGRAMSVVFDAEHTEGVPLVIEVSNDLQSWAPAGDSVQAYSENGQFVIEDTIPLAQERRFFRVTVGL